MVRVYEFYEKAIEILQRKTTIPGDGYTWEDINEAIELAIESIKLRIPTKVISEEWNPNTCPFCLTDLGGDCDDGYYENPHYDRCPVCGQKLKWEGDKQ